MSVSDYFSTFCSNLRMSSDTVSTIQYRYHQITKRINLDYWSSSSETTHSLYVGSYGRGTEIWTSDIDIIVQLPYSTYEKFNAYKSNGQSALLQEVKDKSYLYYDFMSRDFFKYLEELDENQNYWLAPGSQRYVWKNGEFHTKAKTAYNNAVSAISYENSNYSYSAKQKWREIYGTKFPE